jgi:hypothetical protein
MKYDLVYPLGSGSIWQDNELRYSIRSFVKHFDQLGKIFIVGQKPEFINWFNPRLVHIPCEDSFRHNKDANIINKVLQACKRNDLSNDFIRASDDQIILKKVQIDDFFPYYMIDLKEKQFPVNNNNWFKRLKYTVDLLQMEGWTMFHYDFHYPVIKNKDSFIKIMQDRIQDIVINTYYFNKILKEHKQVENIKVTLQQPVLNMQDFLKEIKGKTFLGYNNKGIREPSLLKNWIQNELRDKTEFEI